MTNHALMVIALLSAGPGPAPSTPTSLEMRFEEGETIHLAGQEGAINRRHHGKVSVELSPGGEAEGTDTGTSFEHNLYPTFSTDEETVWVNTWTGTWASKGDGLTLDLALAKRKCTRKKRSTGAPPERLACGVVSKRIRFTCATQQIRLEDAGGKARQPRTQAAWLCEPSRHAALAATPSPWAFGKNACLVMHAGGFSPISYARCGP
jgi:hypothetical protein